MSKIKVYIEDRDELCEGLGSCSLLLEQACLENPSIKAIYDSIEYIIDSLSGDRMYPKALLRIRNQIDTYSQLSKDIVSKSKTSSASLNKLGKLIGQLRQVIISESSSIKAFNTENYYKEEKIRLEQELIKLQTELDKYISNSAGDTNNESDEVKKLRAHITEVSQMIKNIDKESQSAQKRNDAVSFMSVQIKDAFLNLSSDDIVVEKERLTTLYWAYPIGIGVVLSLLIFSDAYFICNWQETRDLYSYIPFYLPIPLYAGLLWAFIYQMNRAQRQLLQIALKLHSIEYVKQLMLAINKLTPDAAEGTSKVCQIMDNIIQEYLHTNSGISTLAPTNKEDEHLIDLKALIDYLKEIKGLLA